MINNKTKIFHFSHNDLDGCGCIILGSLAFESYEYRMLGYNTLEKEVEEFIVNREFDKYEKIIMTDISLSEEFIEKMRNNYKDETHDFFLRYQLVDHHKTALWQNDYPKSGIRACVRVKQGELQSSGTTLFYEWIERNTEIYFGYNPVLFDFLEKVRRYDTWDWYNRYDDQSAQDWCTLYTTIRADKFIPLVIDLINEGIKLEMNDGHRMVLDFQNEEKERYYLTKNNEVEIYDGEKYKVGFVFCERYFSEVGNFILEERTEIDYLIMYNPSNNACSFRTAKDIDVSEIAKSFDGGGHAKAAGMKYDCNLLDKIGKELIAKLP